MEHIIKMDEVTRQQQAHLKQNLINMLMNENTFIRSVDYANPSAIGNAEQSVKVDFFVADSVILTDSSAT